MSGVYNFINSASTRSALDQGATFTRVITWLENDEVTPINITGFTARMYIRSVIPATTTVLELTTENSRIAITGATGKITLSLTATETAALTPGSYYYDLEVINGAAVTRLLEGTIEVTPEVTR